MAPTTRRNGNGLMSSEQEQLERMMKNMEESMVRMSGLVEILVQNQSQPPLVTDAEQADVLWAWLEAEQKKATVEVAAEGTT